MRRILLAVAGSLAVLAGPAAAASPALTIVAAENFYGDLAQTIAGARATVVSILSSPDQDPHLFEAAAATARAIADADIVIANGADYDPWIDKMIGASTSAKRTEIVAADLVGRKSGDNPHLWYDPATMTAVATALATRLATVDPAGKAVYDRNAAAYRADLATLDTQVAALKARYAGLPVTASEPVFGYMAQALGLAMRNERFQTAVMNSTEPSPADVAAFEDDLRTHRVKVMLYNSQADDEAVKRLVGIARAAGVPVVGVTETQPAGKSYQVWMGDQLTTLDKALAGAKS